jgi:Flp pilus assembly secretin CpaC
MANGSRFLRCRRVTKRDIAQLASATGAFFGASKPEISLMADSGVSTRATRSPQAKSAAFLSGE